MTTHGGYTLHLANNPVFYGEVVRGPAGAVWDGGSLWRWQTVQAGAFENEVGLGWYEMDDRGLLAVPPEGWVGRPDELPVGLLLLELAPRPGFAEAGQVRVTRPMGLVRVDWGPVGFSGPTFELARDRWHRDAALAAIGDDPLGFARAVPVRVARFWGPAPLGEAADGLPAAAWWAVCFWNLAVFALAAGGIVRVWGLSSSPLAPSPFTPKPDACVRLRGGESGTNWRPVLLLPVALTAVHAVYWSNARMRAPVVPALAVLAAAGAFGVRRLNGEPAQVEPVSTVAPFGGEGESARSGAGSR